MRSLKGKIVLFPIDTVVREFEWQLVLSLELSKFGYTSIIGHSGVIRELHKDSKNCIWFGRMPQAKFNDSSAVLKEMKVNKSVFYFIDDEGGLYPEVDYNRTLLTRYPTSMNSLKYVRQIFTWGERQKNILISKAGIPEDRILTTGMPRFDLYKKKFCKLFENDVKGTKQEPYILVTTKFGFANSSVEPWQKKIKVRGIEAWKKDMNLFTEYVAVITSVIKALKNVHFIVRPHPAEDLYFYRDIFDEYPNVTVSREGSVSKWIANSNAVVHTGCTTGLEATLASKPTFNFAPTTLKELDLIPVVKEAGKKFDNSRQLIEELVRLNDEETSQKEKYSIESKETLYNIENSSFDKIIDFMKNQENIYSSILIPNKFYTNWKLMRRRSSLKNKKLQAKESHKLTKKPDLSYSRTQLIVAKHNEHFDGNSKIHLFRKDFCVVGPKNNQDH